MKLITNTCYCEAEQCYTSAQASIANAWLQNGFCNYRTVQHFVLVQLFNSVSEK